VQHRHMVLHICIDFIAVMGFSRTGFMKSYMEVWMMSTETRWMTHVDIHLKVKNKECIFFTSWSPPEMSTTTIHFPGLLIIMVYFDTLCSA
jgi:hypothetical protein